MEAALPVGSFYHTLCLDNLKADAYQGPKADAFQGGADIASSVASCLSSVG